ncbi:MAG: FeoB-associated Cys-rich membrane protein [Clostridia bacterium]|nr:FeoB-associated Cys-rich membrane protein [Clostridia bacterium]
MGTFIVAAILIAVVALIIKKLYTDRKNGKSACGCDCGSCGGACRSGKGVTKK